VRVDSKEISSLFLYVSLDIQYLALSEQRQEKQDCAIENHVLSVLK